jgi:hypothetical protein
LRSCQLFKVSDYITGKQYKDQNNEEENCNTKKCHILPDIFHARYNIIRPVTGSFKKETMQLPHRPEGSCFWSLMTDPLLPRFSGIIHSNDVQKLWLFVSLAFFSGKG